MISDDQNARTLAAVRATVAGGGCMATYKALRHARLCDLLGEWVSGTEVLLFERVDVSPQILCEIGIGTAGATAPQFVGSITVDDMTKAEGLE